MTVPDTPRVSPRVGRGSCDEVAALSGAVSSVEAADALFLSDGRRPALRQIGPCDRDGLAALFTRLSPESRRRRFLTPKRELTTRELTAFTEIDHVHHEAIAAIDQSDGSIVGVARYVHNPNRAGVADVAFVVADAFQRMRIGTALATLTIQRAQANGFTLLTATTLRENRPARILLRHLSFRARHSQGGEIEYELELQEPTRGSLLRQGAWCQTEAVMPHASEHEARTDP